MQHFIIVFLLLTFIGCETGVTNTQPSTVKPISEAASVIEANNQFAVEFYTHIKDGNERDNMFFSPYSISTVMAMVYEGARQKTADEIQSVFHFPTDPFIRRSSFEVAQSYFNRNETAYELNVANALWVEKDFLLQDTFKSVVMNSYKGEVFNSNFKKEPEKEHTKINKWVEDETKEKIKDLLPPGSLDTLTRLVLTNAIYFKGNWEEPFEEHQTKYEKFWLNENQVEKVPMMQKTGVFNYFQTEKVQILEIPYETKDLSMLIFLPRGKTEEDFKSLEKSLTTENMKLWKENLEEQRVDVFIPKFTFKKAYNLKGALTKMGMPLAFGFSADFEGINEIGGLYISQVFHKAFIKVNEKGTEAAAATGAVMVLESMTIFPEPQVFKADHPFIFLIQERTTGYILFMGKVANPIK